MTLRSPEIRNAYELVKADKRAKRKERNANAREYAKSWRGSSVKYAKDTREINKPFLAFVRRQPCAAAHLGGCSGPIEAAHVRYSSARHGVANPGTQRKNHDRHANPLCRHHHQSDQHKRKERDFWADVGTDAYDNAARLYADFLAGDERSLPSQEN